MTDERIIAYFLKELPEQDQERFEDECFARESWPTEINLVEEELVDAYLRGDLTEERRQLFERNYLITEARQERVAMAAAVLRHVDVRNAASTPPIGVTSLRSPESGRFRALWSRHTPAWRGSAIAAVALVIGAVSILLIRQPPAETFATLTLTISNSSRAGGSQPDRVKIPRNVTALKISLVLPQELPPAAHYHVELENDAGESRPVKVIEEGNQYVLVVIPVKQLAREEYALNLFGVQADGAEQRIAGSYHFVVE